MAALPPRLVHPLRECAMKKLVLASVALLLSMLPAVAGAAGLTGNVPVPEPASAALMPVGATVIAARRRRQ